MCPYPDNYDSATAPDGHRSAREEAVEDRLQSNIETNRAVAALIKKRCEVFAIETLDILRKVYPGVLLNGQYAQSEHVKHCYSGWVKMIELASFEKAASYLAETLGDFVISLDDEIDHEDFE